MEQDGQWFCSSLVHVLILNSEKKSISIFEEKKN